MLKRFRTKPVVQPSALVEPERIYFQCPSCGASFKVSSEFSERIYCGPCARALSRERRSSRDLQDSPAASPVPEEGK